MLAAALVTGSCGADARDRLSACDAAIAAELHTSDGLRTLDLGGKLGRIDISSLADHLGDLEDAIQRMEDAVAMREPHDQLEENLKDLRSAYSEFQQAFVDRLRNRFQSCSVDR